MKKTLLALILFTIGLSAHEEKTSLLPYEGLAIINAAEEKDILPGNFRMTSVLRNYHGEKLDLTGLSSLHMSGSAQFSERGLEAILKQINSQKCAIINLRQEDGGFIESHEGRHGALAFSYIMPMSWWSKNSDQRDRSIEEIEADEERKMRLLEQEGILIAHGVGDRGAPYDKHDIYYQLEIPVKRAFTEKQLAERKKLQYLRIPDKKFGHKEDEHIDLFIAFVQKLDPDTWVHFHCRRGLSRTTLFMVMFDMMKNAKWVSADDIMRRQGLSGLGGTDLLKLPEKTAWEYLYKKSSLDFLYHFHRYCQENSDTNYQKSWSAWAQEQGLAGQESLALRDTDKPQLIVSMLPTKEDQANSVQESPLVFEGTLNERKLGLSNFRTTQDLWISPPSCNMQGLSDYFASGSSQYGKNNLESFIKDIKKRGNPLVIIELRDDVHLFVEGVEVINYQKKYGSSEEVLQAENRLKEQILSYKAVQACAVDKTTTLYNMMMSPKHIETPKELVQNLGANYLLIATDRYQPISLESIDAFISYYRKQPPNTWYHFHCKKGKSRTTAFLTLLDMMHNADQLSVEEILSRQAAIGGANLLHFSLTHPNWKEESLVKQKWLDLMHSFHHYCRENKDQGFLLLFSEWLSFQDEVP